MDVVHAAAAVAGIALVALTLRSAVKTFVVPRGRHEVISGIVLEIVSLGFSPFIRHRTPGVSRLVSRANALSLFAPVSLLAFYAAWLILTWIGFALVFYGLGTEDVTAAMRLSGSSLFTLGFSEPPSGAITGAVLAEAGIGLFLVALLIGYFPTIYGAYQRREVEVSLMQERAGVAGSGVSLIEHYQEMGDWSAVDALWGSYEVWFADIGESHIAIEILPFYRSVSDDRSWVNTAAVVLDAAALRVSTVDAPSPAGARLVVRAGARSLWGIATHLGLDAGPRPAASPAGDDPHTGTDVRRITVTREQFDAARADFRTAGIPIVADADAAWATFRHFRAMYDGPVTLLASVTFSSPTPWITRMRPPRVRFVGRRRRPSGLLSDD